MDILHSSVRILFQLTNVQFSWTCWVKESAVACSRFLFFHLKCLSQLAIWQRCIYALHAKRPHHSIRNCVPRLVENVSTDEMSWKCNSAFIVWPPSVFMPLWHATTGVTLLLPPPSAVLKMVSLPLSRFRKELYFLRTNVRSPCSSRRQRSWNIW